jgi:hypothetical protein
MRNGIFISYRHRDTQGEASRLADDLREALADVQIFRDVETIEAGADFAATLERALAECSVLLVMIGPTWLEQRDAQGNRRIDNPKDWTRTEIATGLARGVRVIPVKCRDASLPKADQLPAEIQALVRRQAFELDNNRWRYDVERLVDQLVATGEFRRKPSAVEKSPVAGAAAPAPKRWTRRGLIGAGIAILVIAIFAESDIFDTTPIDPDHTVEILKRITDELGKNPTPPSPVQPAPVSPVVPVATQGAVRDISGLWRSSDGEVYQFQQNGRDVTMTLQAHGVATGHGQGTLTGDRLQLAVTINASGIGVNMQCDLAAANNGQSLSGTCVGPLGAFPTQMVR